MADKNIKVKVDIDVDAEPSIAQLKELKKQLKQTAAGSEEFKKLYNQIDDLEDKIKSAKGASADWIDSIESAGGPLGALGGALNKAKVATQSWGAALKATGIGLIVALIGGLVGAFSEQEGAMKKLQPLLIGMEKIFNGIFRAIEPVFNYIVDLAVQALPMVTKAFGVVYSAMTSFLQGLGKIGSAVGKLLKGDFSGAWEDAKSSVTDFGKRYEEANKNFVSGTKEVTKTEKDELEKRKKANEEYLAKKKERDAKAAEEAKKKAEELKKLNEDADKAQLDAFKETLSERERQEYEAGLKLAERRKALAAAGRTDMTGIEAAYQADLAAIKKKYDEEDAKKKEEKDKKDKEDLLKKQADERGVLLTGLQEQFEALDKKNKQSDLDFEQDLIRLADQRKILADQEATELQNTELTEFQKTEIRKKYADARMAITDQEVATEKAAAQAKHEINMAYLGLFEQFGGLLGQIAGKNKALAIAGIVISQAAAIGQIIASTGVANIKAVAASPLTFGQPWVAINTISAGLSIASTVASAAKSISEINSAAASAGVTGGGGGNVSGAASVAMPTAPKATGTTAPEISTGGGNNPNTMLAQTLANAQKPVRAYVVSGDVTTSQALDRRTNKAATFSTGTG